jgi:Uma2 family endonuclease
MIAIREKFPRFTPEEYFAWEEQQLERHEYIDGEVYAMTGGSVNHSDIALNFGALLKSHMRGSGCKTLNSDCRVNIVESNDYVYPDLSVTCDERDKITTQYITYPRLVVEVLSPSTEAYDRGDKFSLYRRSPILQEYVLVSTDKIKIDIYRKNDRDRWEIFNHTAGDSLAQPFGTKIELESINLTFQIEAIFEEIIFA